MPIAVGAGGILTAITNYLAAALRLSQTDATAAGVSRRHSEILE